MLFEILTLFPSLFDSIFKDTVISRGVDKGLVSINCDDIRSYSDDLHGRVDDYPYGGGPGMVIKVAPLIKAVNSAVKRCGKIKPTVIYLSPHGELFSHRIAKELSQCGALVLVCGRYRDVDYRFREIAVDREISIGDYVLSGGELAAAVVVDAVTRLIPNVLGNKDSVSQDSHYDGLLGAPQYTRPEYFDGIAVPPVLLSGHHENVRLWQLQQAELLTKQRRPDLWKKYCQNNK